MKKMTFGKLLQIVWSIFDGEKRGSNTEEEIKLVKPLYEEESKNTNKFPSNIASQIWQKHFKKK